MKEALAALGNPAIYLIWRDTLYTSTYVVRRLDSGRWLIKNRRRFATGKTPGEALKNLLDE